jgi:hypothetical protein
MYTSGFPCNQERAIGPSIQYAAGLLSQANLSMSSFALDDCDFFGSLHLSPVLLI